MRTPANVPVTEPKTEHSLPALEPELDLEFEFEFDEPTTIDPVFVISDEDEITSMRTRTRTRPSSPTRRDG